MFDQSRIGDWLQASYGRLERKGLLSAPGGMVAFRVPACDTIHVCAGPGNLSVGRLVERTSVESLVFHQRSDAGSVVVAQPTWGTRLTQIPVAMPALFDEQVRQLGTSVETLSWMPGESLSVADQRKLARGDTAYLWNGNVVVIGYSLDRVVFNLELLEKCAKSFVLAHLTGAHLTRIPIWVQWIASGRLKKDQRKASSAFARGELPSGLSGY